MRFNVRNILFTILPLALIVLSLLDSRLILQGSLFPSFGFVDERTTSREEQKIFTLTREEFDSIANETYARKTPWHNSNKPFCERDQVLQGKWNVSWSLLSEPYYKPPTSADTRWKSHPYRWIPKAASENKCSFGTWITPRFCQVVRSATILIVGDHDLAFEQYLSLLLLNGNNVTKSVFEMSKQPNVRMDHAVCQGATRVAYQRDDHLRNLPSALLDRTPGFFPQVLVLGQESDYVPDDILLANLQENLQHVKLWLSQCDFFEIKCHFFWRTRAPGHPHCQTFTAPSRSFSAMEKFIETFPYNGTRTENKQYVQYSAVAS